MQLQFQLQKKVELLHLYYMPGVAIVEGKKPGPEPTVVGPLKRMLPRHADDIDMVLRTIQLDFFLLQALLKTLPNLKALWLYSSPNSKPKYFLLNWSLDHHDVTHAKARVESARCICHD